MNDLANQENLKLLTDLLLDVDDLNELEEHPFNVFDVLKVTRTEIRHSNVLAWLFDPYESHGLENSVLAVLNSYLVKYNLISQTDSIDILTMDYSDIIVYRERRNIDILIESKKDKYILCIENKIDTQDHSEQLNKYYDIINEQYDNSYKKIFMYLTPEGLTPNNDKNDAWCCFDYKKIVEIIESALKKSSISEDIYKFIESYCEILRREIMQNNEIVELCQKIYKKHRKALDLIFENRPDRLQNVSEYFKAWCDQKAKSGEIIWDKDHSNKSHTRFRTNKLDALIPKGNGDSGWNTENHYFYEIKAVYKKNGEISYYIKLVFSSLNLSPNDTEKLKNIIEKISKKSKEDNWQWGQVCRTKEKTIKEDFELPENLTSNNKIFTDLDKCWEEMCKTNIENQIEELLKS